MPSSHLSLSWQIIFFAAMAVGFDIAQGIVASSHVASVTTTKRPSFKISAPIESIEHHRSSKETSPSPNNIEELKQLPTLSSSIITLIATATLPSTESKKHQKAIQPKDLKTSLSFLLPNEKTTPTNSQPRARTLTSVDISLKNREPIFETTNETTTIKFFTGIETLYDENNDDNDDGDNYAHTTLKPNIAAMQLHLLSSSADDSLTKGFTIPTFLPPVREFEVADLPSYIASTTTTAPTAMSDELILPKQDQFYLRTRNRQPLSSKTQTLQFTNVSVQIGNHAYMPCNIRRLQNKPISWVRVSDGHILTVDQTTFISDQRFQSIFNEEDEHTWYLQIKYAQQDDKGWYECQVSTEPKISAKIFLEVVVPTTELIGERNRFVKAGSKVALHCIVRGTMIPPTYIIWFREETQIMNGNKMGWYTEIDRNIFGNTSDNQNTIGTLIIPFVRKKDTGNYTCQPENSRSVSIDLHVLSDEYSASAIMSAARVLELNNSFVLVIFFILSLYKT